MVLAAYACQPERSRGRHRPEIEHAYRTPYQRDRDRVIHSTAFRRLEHKTQVFLSHVGDHHRTRLTHSIEVAQVARTVARALKVDEDLAEAIALAHDLGHSPFGHAGEDALDACLKGHGGFDHNVQTLRVITRLEQRYARFDGLNLTLETLEGLIKHNGPIEPRAAPILAAIARDFDVDSRGQGPIEAQIAAIADDIAYANHDLDDGVRAGLVSVGELRALPVVGPLAAEICATWPELDRERQAHETVRRLMDAMITDLLTTTRARLRVSNPQNSDAVRRLPDACVQFSTEMRDAVATLKAFLRQRVYSHYTVTRTMGKARQVVTELFEVLAATPDALPPRWAQRCDGPHGTGTIASIRDYIAGMTDRFALEEHVRLTRLDDVRR